MEASTELRFLLLSASVSVFSPWTSQGLLSVLTQPLPKGIGYTRLGSILRLWLTSETLEMITDMNWESERTRSFHGRGLSSVWWKKKKEMVKTEQDTY